MNKERILAVADAIEQGSVPGLGFNMTAYMSNGLEDKSGRDCGTCACIAGWAVTLFPDGQTISYNTSSVAARILGLGTDQRSHLFFASNFNAPELTLAERVANITAEQAIRTLRNLAETGEVDWTA